MSKKLNGRWEDASGEAPYGEKYCARFVGGDGKVLAMISTSSSLGSAFSAHILTSIPRKRDGGYATEYHAKRAAERAIRKSP